MEALSTNSAIKVIVLGTLGTGKSTMMNAIMNQPERFRTSDEAEGCTQKPEEVYVQIEGKQYRVIDTPGLNDPNMPLTQWTKNYNDLAAKSPEPISLTLIVFKANVRPDAGQKSDVLAVLEAVKGLDVNNLAVVFTFCESMDIAAQNSKGVVKYVDWMNNMQKAIKNCENADCFLSLPPERVFFFSGSAGKMGPATTQQDLLSFIGKHASTNSQATMNDKLEVADICKQASATMDPQIIKMFTDQMEQMRIMYDQSMSQNGEVLAGLQEQLSRSNQTIAEFQSSMVAQQAKTEAAYEKMAQMQGSMVAQQAKTEAAYQTMAQMQANSGGKKKCFNRGTIIHKLTVSQGLNTIVPTPIEHIKEGDSILSQVDGKMDFVEVFLVRSHENYEGQIIRFILQGGQSIEVTPNHCMLVALDSDFCVKLADTVREGERFLNSDGEKLEIIERQILENQVTDVYDVVTPTFKIVANELLACSYGGDTQTMAPKALLSNGMAIYKRLGATKCKEFYLKLEKLAYEGQDLSKCFDQEEMMLLQEIDGNSADNTSVLEVHE